MFEFKNVSLTLQGKEIFQDFSWHVPARSKVLIVGPSGCGKSSLFELILGFKRPDKGQIYFDGQLISAESIWEARPKIAYVDQSVSLPSQKAGAFLDFVFELKKNRQLKPDLEQITTHLANFDLEPSILEQEIDKLSGGEKQRLMLVIAILLKRKVFLLDEVTSALDKELRQKVITYFSKQDDLTVLSISHDEEWFNFPGIRVFDLEQKKWLS